MSKVLTGTVDVGNSKLIKKCFYRASPEKLESEIQYMLKNNVVPSSSDWAISYILVNKQIKQLHFALMLENYHKT